MLIDFEPELPVELLSFNATPLNNKVQLNWSTATETNNSGFEILRFKLRMTTSGNRLVLFRDLELQQNQNHIHSLMKMLQQEFTNTDSSKLILMEHSLIQTK